MQPAPIQVSYMGFPGTTGADYIDYLVTDEVYCIAILFVFCIICILVDPFCCTSYFDEHRLE